MSIVDHLEAHLGLIQQGWSGGDSRLQVCSFKDQPNESLVTLSTLGLSHHVLRMKKDREVRQELLLVLSDPALTQVAVNMLFFLAEKLVETHRAVLCGELLPIPGVSAGIPHSFYAASPMVFDDGLATFDESEPPTVLVWLVPVSASEVAYIQANGWKAFEELFVEVQPDFFDWSRAAIA